MDNNKVKNPKQDSLPNENVFNDEEMLTDIQVSLKHLSTMYGTFGMEASNKSLADQIEQLNKTVSKMARAAYNLMFEKGWYCLEREPAQKLNQEYTKYSQKKEKISA